MPESSLEISTFLNSLGVNIKWITVRRRKLLKLKFTRHAKNCFNETLMTSLRFGLIGASSTFTFNTYKSTETNGKIMGTDQVDELKPNLE